MPYHPIFVHFPIALVIVAFFADVIGVAGRRPSALTVGWACLLLGLIGTLLTVVSGIRDMHAASLTDATDQLVDVHMRIGIALGFLLLGLTIWRGWLAKVGMGTRAMPFLVCFAVFVLLLGFQGWYGGELAYSHGAGVAAAGQGMEPDNLAKQRLHATAQALKKIPGLNVEEEKGGHQHEQAAE